MAFIAHVHGLGNEGFDIDTVREGFEGFVESGVEIRLHPLELGIYFRSHTAEAQYLAETFVHGAVGFVAKGFVFNDENGHVRGNHTGHGANGVIVVAGGKFDLARSGQFLSFLLVLGHAFVNKRAHHGAFGGAAHTVPGDGRTGV
ncbi:hypothetical protein SDC9_108220 [bioreactor metagenome]|uniref:Uncharacterized protein n=1 Tax=bioreactor metagenome TaxID=1076179 RepID=A0A645B7H1_9ZZZZ